MTLLILIATLTKKAGLNRAVLKTSNYIVYQGGVLWKKNVNAVNAANANVINASVAKMTGVSRLRRGNRNGLCRWSTSINDLKLIELMIIANNNNHFQAIALAA